MMASPRFSEAMVEAAAQAEYACDMANEESDDFEPIEWAQTLSSVRKAYLDRARAGLAAALGVCEVREEPGMRQVNAERPDLRADLWADDCPSEHYFQEVMKNWDDFDRRCHCTICHDEGTSDG